MFIGGLERSTEEIYRDAADATEGVLLFVVANGRDEI
jgi:hypothetical protein